jgi:hypothetical protein
MMRFFPGILILPFLVIATANAGTPPKADLGCFQGSLGKHLNITMTLAVRDGHVEGSYRYARYGSPIALSPIGGLSSLKNR